MHLDSNLFRRFDLNGRLWGVAFVAAAVLVLGPPAKSTAGECTSNDDCKGGRQCHEGECVDCLSDHDCGGELICSKDHACVVCASDRQCGSGEICANARCLPSIDVKEAKPDTSLPMQILCDYAGRADDEVSAAVSRPKFAKEADALVVTKQITDTVGLAANFVVMQDRGVSNAAAAIQASRRYVLYNPRFIAEVDARTGSDWAAKSIIAHELGHHLQGHTLDNLGSRPDRELEADEFSGFAMCKLGAELEQAELAMKTFASEADSDTHPGRERRLQAIERGFRHCRAGGKLDSGEGANVPLPAPPPVQDPTQAPQVPQQPLGAAGIFCSTQFGTCRMNLAGIVNTACWCASGYGAIWGIIVQ